MTPKKTAPKTKPKRVPTWATHAQELTRKLAATIEQHIDWLLVTAFIVLAALPVIMNIFQPLWFDEVWRAHIISSWRLHRIDGEAPLPLLFMVLSKLVTLIYNNELTQRIVYVLFGLGLIPALYLFGRKIRNRRYGLLLAGVVPWTYYYQEYISQDKAFLADITFTVLFLWVFHRYQTRTIRLRWFIAFCLLYMLASPSSTFLFAAAGIWQLFQIARQQLRKTRPKVSESWTRLFSWTVPVGISYVVYYFAFLKPQITPGLLSYWQVNEWKGQSLTFFAKYVIKHVASTFGFDVQYVWPQVGINFPVDHTGFISFVPMTERLHNWVWLFIAFIAVWFVIGTVSMVRRGFAFIPLAVLVTWLGSLFLSYFAIAPFGNNRANIFMFGMMYMIALLGLYEILAKLWGQRTVLGQTAFLGILFTIAWFFPLDRSIQFMTAPRGESYLDGMPTAARIVRAQSKPDDLIINYHFMNETSFGYYYNYDSAIRRLNDHPSENIWYDHVNAKPIPDTPEFFKELSKTHKTVWVVWGVGYGHDPTEAALGSYEVSNVNVHATVDSAKLTAKN